MMKPGLYTQPCGGDAPPGEALLQKLGKRSAVLGCCARSTSSASRSINTATVEDTVHDARDLKLTARMRSRRARWEGVLERLQSCGATTIVCHRECAALLYELQRAPTNKHRADAKAAKKSASAPAEEEEDDDTESSPAPSPPPRRRGTAKRRRSDAAAKRPRAPAPLECPICLENLDDASPALACDHRFHAACVQELVAKAWADGAKRTRGRGTAVLCPLCRGQSYVQ